MQKKVLIGLFILFFLFTIFKIEEYYSPFRNLLNNNISQNIDIAENYEIVEVANGLTVPWSVVFTSSNRILVSERIGNIRIIENGKLLKNPLHSFSEVVSGGEEGLMSLALHPNYKVNKLVYASLAYMQENEMFVKVVSFRDGGSKITDLKIILDKIPATQYHAGSRVAFGPDKKLYITTGDATKSANAQDLNSLAGKILRVNEDGSIPEDNPFTNSPIWSYGHRNPQGIAWNESGDMFESEHGPSTFDGPPGGDEVNLIVKGGNYGWPLVSHTQRKEGTIYPIVVFGPKAEAPASLLVYSGKLFPNWKNNLFFGALRGEGLMNIFMEKVEVKMYEKLKDLNLGRIRDVAENENGEIYFSTSNTDGRGNPNKNDDKIYKIIPR